MERMRARRDQVAGQVDATRHRLEDARKTSPTIDTAFAAFEHDADTGGSVLGAALGFRIFLFLVPYVFLFLVGFGLSADATDQSAREAARDAGVTGLTAQAITEVADLSNAQRVSAFIVAAVATFLSGRALYKVTRIAHALVWRVEQRGPARSSLGAAYLFGGATLSFVVVDLLGMIRHDSTVLGLVLTAAFVAVPFAIWLLASWFLPHTADDWRDLIPGAAIVAVGIEVLHILTVYWVAYLVSSRFDTYGTIGVSLGLLVWSYLLGRLIVASAVVNASVWQRRQRGHSGPAPG
jgi:membrane protein